VWCIGGRRVIKIVWHPFSRYEATFAGILRGDALSIRSLLSLRAHHQDLTIVQLGRIDAVRGMPRGRRYNGCPASSTRAYAEDPLSALRPSPHTEGTSSKEDIDALGLLPLPFVGKVG
jgi:hypothetical protein